MGSSFTRGKVGPRPVDRPMRRRVAPWQVLTLVAILFVVLATSLAMNKGAERPDSALPGARAGGPLPDGPRVEVCGNESILGDGPTAPPEGAVVVPAGDNRSVNFTRRGKTFWFAPGVHTLGPGQYSAIIPGRNSRYVGAPGAVLDGRKVNRYAFAGDADGVVVEYLTIQNFGRAGTNNNEGVVNHDSADNWTIRRNTIRQNAGAGLMLGSGNVAAYNCVTRNGQYGFNAYSSSGPVGITLDHNELSYNNTYDWEAKIEGCGCTGGGKFWSVKNAVVTNNYVHHNMGVGLWADNNNRGFLFADNYISDNDSVGVMYETSYNAAIRDNVIVRNALVQGPRNPGFPTGGIYISESGADSRVATRFSSALHIEGNLLKDNWAGIVLWENADRYCGSPANTSTGECTLVNPRVVTARSCRANIDKEPYLSDCRWKTQNVEIHGNTFEHSRAAAGSDCSFSTSCGVMATIANYGTYPDWSPFKGRSVQRAITFQQNNKFYDNTYVGQWGFMPFEQGTIKMFAAWQGSPYRQDAGSTFDSGTGSPPAGS